MKKIGPCTIVSNFSINAYEIEFPEGIGISPIFNVVDLYPYKETESELQKEPVGDEVQTLNWEEQMPKTTKKEWTLFWRKVYPKEPEGRFIFSI